MPDNDLPPFSGDKSTCAKCGRPIEPNLRYASGFVSVIPASAGTYISNDYGGGREAMVRDCPNCGYTWAEALPVQAQNGA